MVHDYFCHVLLFRGMRVDGPRIVQVPRWLHHERHRLGLGRIRVGRRAPTKPFVEIQAARCSRSGPTPPACCQNSGQATMHQHRHTSEALSGARTAQAWRKANNSGHGLGEHTRGHACGAGTLSGHTLATHLAHHGRRCLLEPARTPPVSFKKTRRLHACLSESELWRTVASSEIVPRVLECVSV